MVDFLFYYYLWCVFQHFQNVLFDKRFSQSFILLFSAWFGIKQVPFDVGEWFLQVQSSGDFNDDHFIIIIFATNEILFLMMPRTVHYALRAIPWNSSAIDNRLWYSSENWWQEKNKTKIQIASLFISVDWMGLS